MHVPSYFRSKIIFVRVIVVIVPGEWIWLEFDKMWHKLNLFKKCGTNEMQNTNSDNFPMYSFGYAL